MAKVAPDFSRRRIGARGDPGDGCGFRQGMPISHPQEIVLKDAIARKIIELARQGEHDPVRLPELALKAEMKIIDP